MSARNMAKRTAAGTLALAVCLGGGAIALASAASADANFKFDTRIQGDDRYGTAIAASKAAFPTDGSAQNVILVNGYATVDGLTASYLAGVANAPILYVSDQGADAATKAEIKRLGAKNIWLVGGTTVIPTSVETAIKGDGYNVTRINGSDRYETAKLIAEAGAKIAGKQPSKVFVASGTSFADALAVSPIAYAKGYAIALTEKDSTSDFTKKELGQIGTDNKILVGGTAVVSDKVKADLSITTRVAGDDRAVTANLVSDWAKASEGFNPANAILVGGTNGNGADSLVASALGAKSFSTLHFAGWDATATYFKDKAAQLTGKGFVFGGKAAVSDGQVSTAQSAAQYVAAVSTAFNVSGGDTVVNSVTGARQYTVSGLTAGKAIAIALTTPSSIDNGTFTVDSSKRSAVFTLSATSKIDEVNGVAVTHTAGSLYTFTPQGTSLTFQVRGATSPDITVPVVFDNTKTPGALDVNLSGVPKESFGIGGAVSFKAAATTYAENANAQAVAANDTVTNVFADGFTTNSTGATGKFLFKDNDVYKLGATAITKAQFVSILSPGDVLGALASYSQSPSNASPNTWTITTDVLPAAADIIPSATASSVKLGVVNVTYATGTNFAPGSTSYKLQRRQVSGVNTPVAGAAGQWTTVDTRTVTEVATQKFSETLASGSYEYQVIASSPAFSGASVTSTLGNKVDVSTTSSLAAPGLQRLYLTSNATDVNNLSKGDVFKIVLTQPVAAPLAGSSITVGTKVLTSVSTDTSDTQGAVKISVNTGAEVVDGVSQDAGKVLTVTVLAAPDAAALPFGAGGLAFTASSGIGNTVGVLPTQSGANNKLTQDVQS